MEKRFQSQWEFLTSRFFVGKFLSIALGSVVICVSLNACEPKRDDDTTNTDPDDDTEPPPVVVTPPDLTDCNNTLVDAGQKGTITGVQRGLYSDVKMIPGSSNPVVAFTDQSATVIKLTFKTGSQFKTEIISGDGAATNLRLVILSTGIPIVFWTQGANVKAAVRSNALPDDGSWNAGIIDSGVAPRALEAAVNPLDQVTLTFLTDTATTGRAKFAYCDAPCSSPSGFQNMTPNAYIENTAIVAAQTSSGAGWCKSNSTTYYPVASYSITGNVKYAVCLNSLANCLNSANWTTQVVVATGNVGSKIHLDATVAGDVPKLISVGAAGITPYKMGTTACSSAPAAFSAGSAMGTATSGTMWMTLLMDPTGIFHVAANESTTSVKYYNSTTNSIIGTWNSSSSIETLTLAAAHAGGAALDTLRSGLFSSYSGAAAPFDVRLGRVNNYTLSSASSTFTRYTPDLSGDMQLPAANSALRNIAISTTSAKIPAIAYVDFSAGAATTGKLKYTLRSGATSDSAYEAAVLIPGPTSPQFPSLAFDKDDHPWIGYFDAGSNKFFLATNSRTDGNGNWVTYEHPETPAAPAAPIALPAANNTAIAMYPVSASVWNPVMIVINTNATNKGVRASMFNVTSETWGTSGTAFATIDALTGGALGAANLSTDYDSTGKIVVAFQDLNTSRVKYAVSSDGNTWSTPLSISALNHGQGVSIKLNPSNLKPSISYFDMTGNSVYVASCSATATSCITSGWSANRIDAAAGVSGLATGSSQLLSTQIDFAPTSNLPYVVYPRGQGNDANLVVTSQASGGTWSTRFLAAGANGNLASSPALNFAVAGWGVVGSKNAVGGAVSAFIGPGNWLEVNSCGD